MRVLAAQRAAGLRMDAANVRVNDGAAAGQQVAHVHIHLVPRARGDGVGVTGQLLSRLARFAAGTGRRPRLDALAARIRGHIGA